MQDRTVGIENDVRREQKPKGRHLFRLFFYVFRSAKGMCALFLTLSVALSLLRPLLALIWGAFVTDAQAQNVLYCALLAAAYFALSFVIGIVNNYVNGYEQIERLDVVQANRFQETLDARMYTHISKLPCEDFEVPAVNDRMERVFRFTQDGWDGLGRGVMLAGYRIVAECVSVLSVAATLYLLAPRLAFLVLLAPLPGLYATFVSQKLRAKFVRDNTHISREARYFQKLMMGGAAKEMKTLALGDFLFGKWREKITLYAQKERRAQLVGALLDLVSSMLGAGVSVAASVWAVWLMTRGEMGLGELGACLSLIGTLVASVSALLSSVATFASKKIEAASFFDLTDLPEQKDAAPVGTIDSIEAKNLSYRYPLTDKRALEDVSLVLRKGERVALVGENGAGKSTFVKLLCGLIAPTSGDLIVNGEANPPANARYAAIAAVPQTSAQYTSFTLADNVFLGEASKPRDEAGIRDALSFAGLSELTENAYLGKDVDGTELSGGEWRKLALARAKYRNRGFTVLDEPTSSLDPLAEADIFRRYMDLARGSTLVMVTHRISVAALADRILVFAGGRLVEDGDHETLLAQGGEYARLYGAQAKWYEREGA